MQVHYSFTLKFKPNLSNAGICAYLFVFQHVEAQFTGHLTNGHCIWQILLIGKHQQDGVSEFILRDLFEKNKVHYREFLIDAIFTGNLYLA